jgi:hypothetical protein
MLAQRVGKSAASLQCNARANFLDGGHQRKSKERGPELGISKLRAGLGIRPSAQRLRLI